MFGIHAEFLTDRYIATSHNDRTQAEWPPHPARLFSALVEAWAVVLDEDPDVAEALDWLAELPAPDIHATEADDRQSDAAIFYVPVNDASILRTQEAAYEKLSKATKALQEAENERDEERASKEIAKARHRAANYLTGTVRGDAGLELMPTRRTKKARSFVSVTPESPFVYFIWRDGQPTSDVKGALLKVVAAVARLGHSSSFVHLKLMDEAPDTSEEKTGAEWIRWTPNPDGQRVIRWVDSKQRDYLVEEYQRHKGLEPRVLPSRPIRYQRGDEIATSAPQSDWAGDWFVFRAVGRETFPITACADISGAMHGALVRYADDDNIHPAVSGRDPDGKATNIPHISVVALPFVQHEHADGHILGVAVVVPANVDPLGRDELMRAIGRWEHSADGHPLRLLLGRKGVMEIERVKRDIPLYGLRQNTWCRSAKTWRSVTPVALDRNPGDLHASNPAKADAAEQAACRLVAQACSRIGLPTPSKVEVHFEPAVLGSEHARSFSPFPRSRGRIRRVLMHATLEFHQPVRGPFLIGAGRFRGMGLFRPGKV